MYGNGVKTGMVVTAVEFRIILLAQRVVLSVCTVAVAGRTMRGTVVRQIVTASLPTTATTISGSASFSLSFNLFFIVLSLQVGV